MTPEDTIGSTLRPVSTERADIFPDDLTGRRDLEKATRIALTRQGIAVG